MPDKDALTQLLNTAEAADLLGVSEASVRRWGDAGMFPMQRVGKRQDRRFQRADLEAFLAGGNQSPARPSSDPVTLAGPALPPPPPAPPLHPPPPAPLPPPVP